MPVSRRALIKSSLAAGAAAALIGAPARGQTNAYHVVVAGGGFAGATAAKYLRLWGAGRIRVTLVDPNPTHYSCIMSNLVLEGKLGLANIGFRLSALGAYGVTYVRDWVAGIDAKARLVRLNAGGWTPYDRLVMTGGISFKPVAGLDPKVTPHAWIAGSQTTLLKSQIDAMPKNGVFVMTVPPAPYRCPPGPYERACAVAAILKARGGTPKVIVLDANPAIQAAATTFGKAFSQLYAGIIDYRPNARLLSVDAATKTVRTSIGNFVGDVLNIIPPHRASTLVRGAGLVPAGSDFAPVDPLSYESTLPGFSGVHIIGDSQATKQPKSGHMANAQAKICADAIIRLLNGGTVADAARIASIATNSACFSPITLTEASWLTANYQYDPTTKAMTLAPGSLAESGGWSTGSYSKMQKWSKQLWSDTFQ
ncbi:MAG: NAD(P)/FAD-dependent oxidoreductase [Parvularculaceae bacterium]|nr:NAD(P)/FAD-dependent oxidoreductase [Parvularculaceae bacterium]